jgi:hypothetical protein
MAVESVAGSPWNDRPDGRGIHTQNQSLKVFTKRYANKGQVTMERKLTNLMAIAIKLFKERKAKLPIICIFGHDDLELVTPKGEDYEETRFDCRCYSSDSTLEQVLIKDRPQVIITIGDLPSFPNLIKAPFQIRKRWLHYVERAE